MRAIAELARADERYPRLAPLAAAASLAVLRWHIHFSRVGIQQDGFTEDALASTLRARFDPAPPLAWGMPSEGLLLFTNDTSWAARITDPASGLEKTYHVQVEGLPAAEALAASPPPRAWWTSTAPSRRRSPPSSARARTAS